MYKRQGGRFAVNSQAVWGEYGNLTTAEAVVKNNRTLDIVMSDQSDMRGVPASSGSKVLGAAAMGATAYYGAAPVVTGAASAVAAGATALSNAGATMLGTSASHVAAAGSSATGAFLLSALAAMPLILASASVLYVGVGGAKTLASKKNEIPGDAVKICLLYTSPSPRD